MKNALYILEQEIKWHEEHRNTHPNKDYSNGFVNGMKHIKWLLLRCEMERKAESSKGS